MSQSENKHIVVIGAGPGGYPTAFLAADLGMQVTMIDPEPNPGGVCLYRGCIPTKTLLHGAQIINEVRESSSFGLDFGEVSIDLAKMAAKKDEVIAKLTGGLGLLAKNRNIQYIQGMATFNSDTEILVKKADGTEDTLSFDSAVIATGTRPMTLPFINMDSPLVMNSAEAMDLPDVPETMLVIGGGYIGLEMGSIYASLGSEVSVVDILPQLLPGADADLVRTFSMRARKTFKEMLLKTKVTSVKAGENSVTVMMENAKAEAIEKTYSKVLLTVGRTPNSDTLALENTSVEIDGRGFIKVDELRRTAAENIYAIGDVVGGAMLAHKATAEGKAAVYAIDGQGKAFAPKAIPAVLFTDPEVTWVGMTEAEASEQGIDVTVAKFNWAGSGRCLSLGRMDGLTKLIINNKDETILGVGIVGPGAGELIAEGALAVELGLKVKDVAHTIHPHPTLSETVMEAAESYYGLCTHQAPPRKR